MSARFSPCRTWRYTLSRHWGKGGATPLFIMLNPSTADETEDDPTIRRCIGFAKFWGWTGVRICNIFALRSTDPKMLYDPMVEPIGRENNEAIRSEINLWAGPPIVCAWGNHGALMGRGRNVLQMIVDADRRPSCLGVTKLGQPKHPLYLRSDSLLQDYR